MNEMRRVLVVEDDEDGAYLLQHVIRRQLPDSEISLFRDGDAAAASLAERWSAVVVHRSLDADGPPLVARLRAIDAKVPIVMISGRDQAAAARAAGANHFVPYADWQLLGMVLADVQSRPGR